LDARRRLKQKLGKTTLCPYPFTRVNLLTSWRFFHDFVYIVFLLFFTTPCAARECVFFIVFYFFGGGGSYKYKGGGGGAHTLGGRLTCHKRHTQHPALGYNPKPANPAARVIPPTARHHPFPSHRRHTWAFLRWGSLEGPRGGREAFAPDARACCAFLRGRI
jgi:hypothetical protein